ncbi:hypothetical protein [Devosia naphthalenivorans]|uniref:hypothetical protein n=1 Tax=Devosia naphthalenivorans TaxID=2082392 RepID=UPI000D37A9EF|nr:hypothetical protein [Devosia naphthalenivorans]
MALDSRLMAMVAKAKGAYERPDIEPSLLNDLAELGLAKATKKDLQRIVVRAAKRDQEDALRREVLEELDSLN